MNAAGTASVFAATALVLFMTLPALALFFDLVRAQRAEMFMQVFTLAGLMSVLWLVAGYSIAFGDGGGWWGGMSKVFLPGVTADSLTGTIPEIQFIAFQMTFAVITSALVVGACVERFGFGFVLVFSSLWMLLVDAPAVHWIWAAG